MPTLRAFDNFRGAEPLGALWTLHKQKRTAVCSLSTHPLGWEVTARVDGELMRSEVCKNEARVFDVAEAWKPELEGRAGPGSTPVGHWTHRGRLSLQRLVFSRTVALAPT